MGSLPSSFDLRTLSQVEIEEKAEVSTPPLKKLNINQRDRIEVDLRTRQTSLREGTRCVQRVQRSNYGVLHSETYSLP